MKKLKCVLLVEDDQTHNFFNSFLIESLALADQVAVAENGADALQYLERAGSGEEQMPELILLDINMPVMNGFEFIDTYEKLNEDMKSKILVVMLTTSMRPTDIERAKSYPSIAEYLYKPVSQQTLSDLIGKYF
jgi:CheY-like chemotaxis protein